MSAALTAAPFAAAVFASAALLFVVEPMAGKVLLPLAGGTPAVWTTCLVFFQAALLGGYLYAHRGGGRTVARQVVTYLGLLSLALPATVLARPDPEWIPEDQDYPVAGLLLFLGVLVGLPFLFLSASGPLLQRWYAARPGAGRNPYVLYAASNAGSLLGLLAYPFVIEPALPLDQQWTYWLAGYAAFIGLAGACGLVALRSREPATTASEPVEATAPPTRSRKLKWVALAALPSSLLMSATTHLTTDVAPVPLLWVVPLALYLLSFVVVFARWPGGARAVVGRAAPMLLVFLTFALSTGATEPVAFVAGLHLAAFFAVALLCHGELAHDRPARDHLTAFYLTMSAGGVIGGLFNAVAAPVLFTRLGLAEYPLAVVFAALVRPTQGGSLAPIRLRLGQLWPLVAFAGLVAGLAAVVPHVIGGSTDLDRDAFRLAREGLTVGLPCVVAFALARDPVRFAVCLAAILAAGRAGPGPHGTTLLTERNFFGTLRVTRSADGRFVRLVHGTTQHGQQRADEHGPPRPLTYYHRHGPVGRLFRGLPPDRTRRAAVVGLGCGAMAAYARPGEAWAFYEIDPGVVRVARDSGYFTFLRDCAVEPRIVLGDARRRLAQEPDGSFDLIVLDAFSSDAIPVHLLTREAAALYARKLAPNGVLAFHLSNRYLDLPPLVARVLGGLDPPFAVRVDTDHPFETDEADGAFPSTWAVAARAAADLGGVTIDAHWAPLRPTPGPVWRDDFSNLLAAWKRDE